MLLALETLPQRGWTGTLRHVQHVVCVMDSMKLNTLRKELFSCEQHELQPGLNVRRRDLEVVSVTGVVEHALRHGRTHDPDDFDDESIDANEAIQRIAHLMLKCSCELQC